MDNSWCRTNLSTGTTLHFTLGWSNQAGWSVRGM